MYNYICKECNNNFYTKKKNQIFCCRSCANGFNTKMRKVQEKSIFSNGLDNENSYILGLIISDGCISYDKHSHRYRITITLNDCEIIEYLNKRYSPTKKYMYIKIKIVNQ